MAHGFSRFYVAGQSPKALVTNNFGAVIKVRIWLSDTDSSGTQELSPVYVQFDKDKCTLHEATPMPGDGTILELTMAPGQVLYGVSDDIGQGGIYTEPA